MFFAEEGRGAGKGEEALFYYITRRMKQIAIAIIFFKGKRLFEWDRPGKCRSEGFGIAQDR